MPTFCRHNRFVESCPICSKVPRAKPAAAVGGGTISRRPSKPAAGGPGSATRRRSPRAGDLVVRRVARSADDGYENDLVPGLRASADAVRLAGELAWAAARLEELTSDPPGLYGEAAALGAADVEEGLWLAAQIAVLSPLEGDDPWVTIAAVRTTWASGEIPVLAAPGPGSSGSVSSGSVSSGSVSSGSVSSGSVSSGSVSSGSVSSGSAASVSASSGSASSGSAASVSATTGSTSSGSAAASSGPARGPRAASGDATLAAYRARAERAGSQHAFLTGEPSLTPQRRFDLGMERLAVPGMVRAPRYELLVVCGRLGLLDAEPWSPALGEAGDAATLAAKRVFGIGDTMNLHRRAAELMAALGLPVAALDLALVNWSQTDVGRITAGARVTATGDEAARVASVLGVSPN